MSHTPSHRTPSPSSSNAFTLEAALPASLDDAWSAISDSTAFGTWFGAEFDGPFVAGETVSGRIVPTAMDPEIAKAQEPYRGTPMTLDVVAVDPQNRFAFRWNPSPNSEVQSTVTFVLEPAGDGVHLSISESGFDNLPAEQRASARESSAGGWEAQLGLIAKYLDGETTG